MTFVQTSLTKEEYKALKEALTRRGLSVREGLRQAALRVIAEGLKLDPSDPFFTRKPAARSRVRDLSARHDNYLYTRDR